MAIRFLLFHTMTVWQNLWLLIWYCWWVSYWFVFRNMASNKSKLPFFVLFWGFSLRENMNDGFSVQSSLLINSGRLHLCSLRWRKDPRCNIGPWRKEKNTDCLPDVCRRWKAWSFSFSVCDNDSKMTSASNSGEMLPWPCRTWPPPTILRCCLEGKFHTDVWGD